MRRQLIDHYFEAAQSAATPTALREVLTQASRELTEAEYTVLLAKLCAEIGRRK